MAAQPAELQSKIANDSKTKNDIQTFLDHIAKGRQDEAEAMLKANKELALAYGDITDHTKKIFKNITGFQYAVWALDRNMWTLLLSYLSPEAASEQAKGFTQGSWVKEHSEHANWQKLLDALQIYIDKYDSWSWDQREKHWVGHVGATQFLLPAHVLQEYCNPNRPFEPCPNFSAQYTLVRRLPDWLEKGLNNSKFDFVLFRHVNKDGCVQGSAGARGPVWAPAERRTLVTLYNTRVQERSVLIAKLAEYHAKAVQSKAEENLRLIRIKEKQEQEKLLFLQQQSQNLQSEITKLKQEITIFQQAITQQKELAQQHQKQYEEEIKSHAQTLALLNTKAQQQKTEISRLTAQGREHQEESLEFQQIKEKYNKLKNTLANLKSKAQTQLEAIEHQRTEREAAIKSLQSKLETLEIEDKHNQLEMETLRTKIETATSSLTILQQQTQKVIEALTQTAANQQKQREEEQERLTKQIQNLQEIIKQHKKTLDKLSVHSAAYQKAETEYQTALKMVEQCKLDIKQLKQAEERAKEKAADQQKEQETTLARLKQELNKFKELEIQERMESESLKEKIDTIKLTLLSSPRTQKKAEQLQQQLETLHQTSSSNTEELVTLEKTKVQLNQEIRALEKQTKGQEEILNRLKKQEGALSELLEKSRQTRSTIEELQADQTQLSLILAQNKDNVQIQKQLEMALAALKPQLEAATKLNDPQPAEDSKVSQETSQLEQELERLKQEQAQLDKIEAEQLDKEDLEIVALEKQKDELRQQGYEATIKYYQRMMELAQSQKNADSKMAQDTNRDVVSLQALLLLTMKKQQNISVKIRNSANASVTPVDIAKIEKELTELRSQWRTRLLKEASQALNPESQQKEWQASSHKKEADDSRQTREKRFILKNPFLSDYYYAFQLKFYDVLLACKALQSELIDNNPDAPWDSRSLKALTRNILFSKETLEALETVSETWNYLQKKTALNQGIQLLSKASELAESLARQLALAQMSSLPQLIPPAKAGFFGKQWQQLQAKEPLFEDDNHSELITLIDGHCRKLLIGIFQSKTSTREQEPEFFLQSILKPNYVTRPIRERAFDDAFAMVQTAVQKESIAAQEQQSALLNSNSPMNSDMLSGNNVNPVLFSPAAYSNVQVMPYMLQPYMSQPGGLIPIQPVAGTALVDLQPVQGMTVLPPDVSANLNPSNQEAEILREVEALRKELEEEKQNKGCCILM